MTQSMDIHFDSEYNVDVRRIDANDHVSVTVYAEGNDFTMYFPSETAAREFLATVLHELKGTRFPVEVQE